MAENYIEMELREIQIVEDYARTQIIVLGEKDGDRAFPIFIGLHEAVALDFAVRGELQTRPLTHDLILNVIDGLNAKITRIMVVKLERDTFYGALELQTAHGEVVRIDSRPSDAMVIAMKRQAPIFVEEKVLRDVQRDPTDNIADDDEDVSFE